MFENNQQQFGVRSILRTKPVRMSALDLNDQALLLHGGLLPWLPLLQRTRSPRAPARPRHGHPYVPVLFGGKSDTALVMTFLSSTSI